MTAADLWFPYRKPSRNAAARLFCFPYAAKGASSYRAYSDLVPSWIEVCAAQLPGREERLGEPALSTMEEIVERLTEAMRPYLDLPFATFGQSMGAIVQFEIARALRSAGEAQPEHVFVVRERAPQLLEPAAESSEALSDEEYVADPRRLPPDSPFRAADPHVMELMLPTYRADSLAIERYEYVPGDPLRCPITVFGADDDDAIARDDLEAWAEQTSGAFRLVTLPVSGWELMGPEAEATILETVVGEFDVLL